MQAKTAYRQAQQLLSRDYQGKFQSTGAAMSSDPPTSNTQTGMDTAGLSANHEQA